MSRDEMLWLLVEAPSFKSLTLRLDASMMCTCVRIIIVAYSSSL